MLFSSWPVDMDKLVPTHIQVVKIYLERHGKYSHGPNEAKDLAGAFQWVPCVRLLPAHLLHVTKHLVNGDDGGGWCM